MNKLLIIGIVAVAIILIGTIYNLTNMIPKCNLKNEYEIVIRGNTNVNNKQEALSALINGIKGISAYNEVLNYLENVDSNELVEGTTVYNDNTLNVWFLHARELSIDGNGNIYTKTHCL